LHVKVEFRSGFRAPVKRPFTRRIDAQKRARNVDDTPYRFATVVAGSRQISS